MGMGYQFTTLCYIRFLSVILAIALIPFLWRKRRSRGATYLLFFEILATIWAFSDAMEAAAPSVHSKLFWSQLGYIGITNSAVMFLMFSLAYSRNYRFSSHRWLYLLFVIPVLTIIIAFTNESHHLLWTDITVLPGSNNSVYYYGAWFWVNVTYQYTILVSGLVILIAGAWRTYSRHRAQSWLLIISVILPFCASILYVFKLLPVKGVDFTPIAFILSGIIIAFSLYRLDLFNIVPIAHRQTIDNLDDGIVILDSQDRIVNLNPAFMKITGKTMEELRKKDMNAALSYFKLSNKDFTEEYEFRAESTIGRDTDRRIFELRLQPVTDGHSNRIGHLIIARDITLNKMILEAVSESNIERSKELAEKEKLIKDLDAYARMVAHDLKNPIGAISSLTYLIEDAIKSDKTTDAAEMVEMVRSESSKMTRIIDDLLVLSRLRKEEIRIARIDIDLIIREAVQRQHNLINRKEAVINLPETWPEVYGHSQWVEQVWTNLINNALKYGGHPPVINISWENTADGYVRFRISDNGKGLPPESINRLFNDFERLGNKDSDGTGLGLSIVKRIVNKMGGEITAESSNRNGEGCTFIFTLPSKRP